MSAQELPEKYRFKKVSLDNYVDGMKFPAGFMSDVSDDGEPAPGEYYNPKHPCAEFMAYLIRVYSAANQGDLFMDPKEHWLDQKALTEAVYLDEQATAGTVVFSKSIKDLERLGCIGAIDVFEELVNDLEKAVDYLISKEFPTDKYPFTILVDLKNRARKNLETYQTRHPGFEIIRIGD